jgi:RNA polymerase sigma-70 factor (ECF subfamily)
MLVLEQEKDILKKIKKGDKEAFGELYDFYAPKIYRFVRLKVDSQETAQDLTSEAFLKIWQHIQDQRKIRERFQSLLYKIARNLVIDFYRARSVREILIEDNFEEFSKIEADNDSSKLTIRKEELKEARMALAQIHPSYQDVIVWHFIDELSITEISEILDKNEGTVRVLIHRAVKSLRRVMEEVT